MSGRITLSEIESQPDVWQDVLSSWPTSESRLSGWREKLASTHFIFTGCGTTYALGLSSAVHFGHYGMDAHAYPASELAIYPERLPAAQATLVAISRSGKTTETLRAVQVFKQRLPDCPVLAITTQPGSPLSDMADLILEAPYAYEESVVETRSFTSMLLVSRELGGFLGRDPELHRRLERTPQLMIDLNKRCREKMKLLGENLDLQRIFFLGAGSMYGLALECMYKMKQFAAGWAEAFHPLEFRHGPITLAGPGSLVVCLLSDRGTGDTLKLLRELQQRGAHCLVLVDRENDLDQGGVEDWVELRSDLEEWERGILVLPPIHWLAFYRALRLGRNPDKPVGLPAVTLL